MILHHICNNTRPFKFKFHCFRSIYELHDYKICRNYNLLRNQLEKRQDKQLLSKQDIDLALISAAYQGNLEGVKLLLDNGADIKAVDGNFNDAVIVAASNQETKVVRYLLQNGAPPNEANVHHYTPLVYACYEGNLDLVHLFLHYIDFEGCSQSINPRCEEENRSIPFIKTYSNKMRPFPWHTPLMIAVMQKNFELVKILLDANVPLDELDRRGNTAVHHAVQYYCPEILDLILAAKPKINLVNHQGETPLIQAFNFGFTEEIVFKLISYGADVTVKKRGFLGQVTSVLCKAVSYSSTSQKLIHLLCEKGADPNFRNSMGETPLSIAVANNHTVAMKILVHYGCQLDSTDRMQLYGNWKKKTLLEVAILGKNWETIRLLYAVGGITNKALHLCINDIKLREHCTDKPEIFASLEDLASTPLKLSLMCRNIVREVIQKPMSRTVSELGLPPPVKEFLLYSDIY